MSTENWEHVGIESLVMDDERSLIDHVNEHIQRQAQLVLERGKSDKSSITVTVKLEAIDAENVGIEATVKATDPAGLGRGCIARVTPDGQVLKPVYVQAELPGVTSLRGGAH